MGAASSPAGQNAWFTEIKQRRTCELLMPNIRLQLCCSEQQGTYHEFGITLSCGCLARNGGGAANCQHERFVLSSPIGQGLEDQSEAGSSIFSDFPTSEHAQPRDFRLVRLVRHIMEDHSLLED